jgi:hypothetical protein
LLQENALRHYEPARAEPPSAIEATLARDVSLLCPDGQWPAKTKEEGHLLIAYNLAGLQLRIIGVPFFIGRLASYPVWTHILRRSGKRVAR